MDTSQPEQPPSSICGRVLVLNRNYMAVHVITVRRALVLLYQETAEVVDVENGQYQTYDFESWLEISQFMAAEWGAEPSSDWVRGVGFSIRSPRVIRLNFYDKVPRLTLRFSRRNLFARDQNQCQYCGRQLHSKQLSFDHVIPRSRGGKTNWENVVCCCLRCNGKKGDRNPREAGMKLIRQPRRPHYNPLLSVNADNPRYQVWKTFLPSVSTSPSSSAY